MSMLAERKQKQRWSLNPRGKQWTEDSNKFGQKMLEKMGWKHGRGLGANEDGITEHVKLGYKNDQKGMGYKETEQWTEHEDNFSKLLSNLNGGSNRDDAFKADSLHEKAETVKTRINYHKFTKGKDLSRYSEKDLANIFGKKTLKPKNKVEVVSDKNEAENESGVLINKGSISDYFKKKMPAFGTLNASGIRIGNNGVLTMGSESDSERPSFGTKNEKKRKYEDDTLATEIVQDDKRKRTYSEDAKRINEGYDKIKSSSEEHVKKKSNKVESSEESAKINKKKLKNCEGTEEIKIVELEDKFWMKKSNQETSAKHFSISTDQIIEGRRNNLETSKKFRSKSENFREANDFRSEKSDEEEENFDATKKGKKTKRKLGNVENCGFMNIHEEIDDFTEVLETKNIGEKSASKKIKRNEMRENIFFKIPLEELYDNTEEDFNGIRGKNVEIEEIGDFTKGLSEEEVFKVDREIRKARKKSAKSQKNIDDENSPKVNSESVPEGIFLKNSEEKDFKNKKIKNRVDLNLNVSSELYKTSLKSDEEITKKRKKSGKVQLEKSLQRNVKKSSDEDEENFEGAVFLRHTQENDNFKKKIKNQLGGEKDSKGTTEGDGGFRKKRTKTRSDDEEILRLDDKTMRKEKKSKDDEEIVKIDEMISKKSRKSANEDDDNRKRKKVKKEGETSSKPKKSKTHEETVEEKAQPIFNIKGKVKKIAEMIDFNKTKVPSILSGNKKDQDMNVNLQISTLKKFTKKLMEVSSKIDDKPTAAGVVNPGFDPLYNKVTVAKHVLNTIEESNEEAEPTETIPEPRLIIEYENGVYKPIFESMKRKHDGIENPCFEDHVEPKTKGIVNPALDISDTDLMLNVVTTPILKCEKSSSRPARKNVRFSNRNEERIIPNNGFVNNGFIDGAPAVDDRSFFGAAAKPDGDRPGKCGVDNAGFNARSQRLSEKVETMSKGIENCQAELDNDINELRRWTSDEPVGEVGRPAERHAPVPDGVRLSFRNVRFGKNPRWMNTATTHAKKSYKHLIRGDIIVAFKNSNLHQINGYGVE